jgi:hypothetical protein
MCKAHLAEFLASSDFIDSEEKLWLMVLPCLER